ncbi:MAG: hypothetical protein WKF35_13120 [Ferruginibacter sp.]
MNKNKKDNEINKQFDELPLPDIDASWQKMETLLNKDKSEKPIVPLFLSSCAGWGLLVLVLSMATWFILQPEKVRKPITTTNQTKNNVKLMDAPKEKKVAGDYDKQMNISNKIAGNASEETKLKTTVSQSAGAEKNSKNITLPFDENKSKLTTTLQETNNYASNKRKTTAKSKSKVSKMVAAVSAQNEAVMKPKTNNVRAKKISDEDLADNVNRVVTDSTNNNEKLISAEERNLKITSDTIIAISRATSDSVKKDLLQKKKKSKSKFTLSAGIGLQQQIPFGGQRAVPYDYYGRKSSLSDYIPSLYMRLQKERKWFLQAEFRYGAPQSLNDFSYNRHTKFDVATNNLTTTTYRLKKTYYHQLPFSFNYYVLPGLSLGTGVIYNRFYGAITEKEINNKNLQTLQETSFREIVHIKQFTDSFLYKTQVHILLEANYEWKQLGFSLRYTKDVQPFIKYTKPDGMINVEKNQTMQFLIRYRLWNR